MLQYSHILVIVDDAQLATRLAEGLRSYGYGVTWEVTAQAGLNFALHHEPHLFIIGKTLPTMSGQQFAVKLRHYNKMQPIIMLDNGHGTTEPLVAASSTLGQVTIINERTPHDTLVACVRGHLHRAYGKKEKRDLIVAGDLVIDIEGEKVWRGNQTIPLTRSEFRILSYLARHPGETMGRQQIWQALHAREKFAGDEMAIKAEVRRLREKISSRSKEASMIVTVPGIGYRLVNRSFH